MDYAVFSDESRHGYCEKIPQREWRAWGVPFDADTDWPEPLRQALAAYCAARRAKMEEVNAYIAANADVEELPQIVKDTVRVAGPFTMEGVIAFEEGPDSPIGGAPEELDMFPEEDAADLAVGNAKAHLHKIIRLFMASGVDFGGNRNLKFRRLEPMSGAALVHAEGEWLNGAEQSGSVAVSIGPEAGNATAMQVEEVIRHPNRAGYDDLPFPRPANLAPGQPWRIAVKVIDPRGNEGVRVLPEDTTT